MPRWTADEDAALREHYPTHGAVWGGWADILPDRPANGISYRAYKLGIRCVTPYTPRDHGDLERANENAETAVRALGEWERMRLRMMFRRPKRRRAVKA